MNDRKIKNSNRSDLNIDESSTLWKISSKRFSRPENRQSRESSPRLYRANLIDYRKYDVSKFIHSEIQFIISLTRNFPICKRTLIEQCICIVIISSSIAKPKGMKTQGNKEKCRVT